MWVLYLQTQFWYNAYTDCLEFSRLITAGCDLNSSAIGELREWWIKGWCNLRANWSECIGYPWQPCEQQPPGIITVKKPKQRISTTYLPWRQWVSWETSLTRSVQQQKTCRVPEKSRCPCKNPPCTPPWERLLASNTVWHLTQPKLHLATAKLNIYCCQWRIMSNA